MKKPRIGTFWSAVVTLGFIYGLVKWGIPAVSREVTTLPFPLPVPGALMFIYMIMALMALFLLITFSDEGLDALCDPTRDVFHRARCPVRVARHEERRGVAALRAQLL